MTRTGIRLLSALLLLIMLPGAGAASAEAMPARDAWAIEKAKALAARMQVLAGDGQYIQLYMAQPAEGQDALLDALRAQDWNAPAGITIGVLPGEEALNALLQAMLAENAPSSEVAREEIYRRMPQTLVSGTVSMLGAQWLAVASVLTVSESYPAPEDFAPCIVLLHADSGAAMMAAFCWSGEGIVNAQMMFADASAVAGMEEIFAMTAGEGVDKAPLFETRGY